MKIRGTPKKGTEYCRGEPSNNAKDVRKDLGYSERVLK